MSVFSPTSSDADVAPRLIWQVSGSMTSPLFTGWFTWCLNFYRNWRWHLFSSHPFTLHLLVNKWEVQCQQHRSSDLTLQNEKTTTCESNSTIAPSNRCKLCSAAWMTVSMPLSINLETLKIGRFMPTTVKPTRGYSTRHRKFSILIP